jgi:hypothetical protein
MVRGATARLQSCEVGLSVVRAHSLPKPEGIGEIAPAPPPTCPGSIGPTGERAYWPELILRKAAGDERHGIDCRLPYLADLMMGYFAAAGMMAALLLRAIERKETGPYTESSVLASTGTCPLSAHRLADPPTGIRMCSHPLTALR